MKVVALVILLTLISLLTHSVNFGIESQAEEVIGPRCNVQSLGTNILDTTNLYRDSIYVLADFVGSPENWTI